jgi:hypothetical protein
MLKQIACIAAYATGFAVGTYATCKAVKAIELRWPMKSNPLECDIHLHVPRRQQVLLRRHEGRDRSEDQAVRLPAAVSNTYPNEK